MRVPSSRASATAARWRERFSRSPKRSARRSTTIAPALWRELAYRSSGLPSPRISQGPVSRRDAPASSPPVAGSAAFVPERRQRSSRDRCDYASSPPSEASAAPSASAGASPSAASAAPSSSASTGSTVGATTETTDDSGSSRIVAPDGALRSPTRRTSPICRPDTSPSIASGTAVTSASTLSWCRSWSRMPPWTTPGASPTRWTGTDTVTFSPRRTTRKSTWVKVPRTGCRWTSRASARWRTLPSWSSSRALAPPLRIAWPNARASIDRCSGLMPWPYRTAGTRPAARTRRAAPFPVSVRDSAASWYSDMGNEPPCRVRRFSSEAGTATRNGPAAGGGAAQGSSAARTGSSRAPGAAAGCRDRSGRRAGRHASAAARAGLGLLDPGRGLGAGRGVHGAAHPVGGRHARPHVRALHAPRGAGVVLAEEGQERADRLLVLGVQPTLGGHLLQALPELTGAPDDGSGRVDHNDQVLAGGEQAPEARSRPHRVRRLGERLVAGGHRPSQVEGHRALDLLVVAGGRVAVGAPALEMGGMPETPALHVVVGDLADQLGAERLPGEVLATAPAGQPAGDAFGAHGAHPRVVVALVEPVGRDLVEQLLAARQTERGGHPDVLQLAPFVVEAEQQRADHRPALVPAEPRHDTVGGAGVLDLEHHPLVLGIGQVARLGDHPVEAGALEGPEPALGQPVEGDQRGGCLHRQQLHPGGRRVQPQLQRLEVQLLAADQHDLAVDHAAWWELLASRGDQLGEIAPHGQLIAAGEFHLVAVAEDDQAETVPFGLVEHVAGQDRHRFGEHRLDRRHDWQVHTLMVTRWTGLQARPRGHCPALDHVGLDQRPGSVADRADRLAALEERPRERDRLRVGAKLVRIGHTAGQDQSVVVAGVRLVHRGGP